MGFDKLFADLDGAPVLRHTLDAFQSCDAIDAIFIVTAPSNFERIEPWKAECPKLIQIIAGGAERHLSVHNGLAALPPGTAYVAVHDGARPLATPELIARCVEAAALHGAAAAARPITDTIMRAGEDHFVTDGVERAGLWAMETPQVIKIELLKGAYKRILAGDLAVTDEVSALRHCGKSVLLVENPAPNIKITYPGDLETAGAILRHRRP